MTTVDPVEIAGREPDHDGRVAVCQERHRQLGRIRHIEKENVGWVFI
jgi:hypothetical protein